MRNGRLSKLHIHISDQGDELSW